MDLGQWEDGEDTGRLERGETITRIYYLKKYILIKIVDKCPAHIFLSFFLLLPGTGGELIKIHHGLSVICIAFC